MSAPHTPSPTPQEAAHIFQFRGEMSTGQLKYLAQITDAAIDVLAANPQSTFDMSAYESLELTGRLSFRGKKPEHAPIELNGAIFQPTFLLNALRSGGWLEVVSAPMSVQSNGKERFLRRTDRDRNAYRHKLTNSSVSYQVGLLGKLTIPVDAIVNESGEEQPPISNEWDIASFVNVYPNVFSISPIDHIGNGVHVPE